MPYDVTKYKQWQIAELAEANMPTPEQWTEKLGLKKEEVISFGRICKLDFLKIMITMAVRMGPYEVKGHSYL
jgi:formate--tetrahydrofolate ligase